MSRVVGVVPAAGHATRLPGIDGSKEICSVGGRPVLEYVVERLRAAAVDDLRVVTRPEKEDVVEHARHLDATIVLGRPPSLAASFALGCDGLAPDDIALLGLPDTVWEPADAFVRLLRALTDAVEVVLGLFPAAEPERSDVVVVDAEGRVAAVEVKPARPSSAVLWGCAAVRARAVAEIGAAGDPGLAFDALARRGKVRGVRFDGWFLDIGTPEALRRARDQLGV